MILHGFAKLSTFSVVAHNCESITFERRSDEESRKTSPFAFVLRMTYTLDGASVTTAFEMVNPMADRILPFSVGGHPGFNIPFCEGKVFEDYYLEFACRRECRKLVACGGRSLRNFNFFSRLIATACLNFRFLPQSPTAPAPSRRDPLAQTHSAPTVYLFSAYRQ